MMRKDYFKLIVLLILLGMGIYILVGLLATGGEPTNNNNDINIQVLMRNKDVNYMYGIATAYTPSAGGINADSDPFSTSIGLKPENGIIAVNPEVIPYGSEVMIIHHKTVIRGRAGDTGGAMRQNPKQVDILMEELQDAMDWGRREVHIIWW